MGRLVRRLKPYGEKGVVLLLTAGMALVMITVIAFAVELGRIIITARNLQAAADGAALAAVQRLQKCDPTLQETTPLNFDCSGYTSGVRPTEAYPPSVNLYSSFAGTPTPIGGWQAVKPAVVEVLDGVPVPGAVIPRVTWGRAPSSWAASYGDAGIVSGYGNLGYVGGSTAAGLGDFTVKVERFFECNPNPSPTPVTTLSMVSLETTGFNYCLANAAKVTVTYDGLNLFFSRLFGMSSTRKITLTKSATARIRPSEASHSCEFQYCTLATPGAPSLCKPTIGTGTPAVSPTPTATSTGIVIGTVPPSTPVAGG